MSSGVVDASHGISNGIFQVGVLYFTGSQATKGWESDGRREEEEGEQDFLAGT